MDDDWADAVKLKAGAAEARFAQSEPITSDDMVAIALVHPEKFEINIKLKEPTDG